MQRLIRERFLLIDYDQLLYQQYQSCQQKGRSVSEYAEEFYLLNARVDLKRQQVSRFLNGLNDSLRDQLALQSIWRQRRELNHSYYNSRFATSKRHSYENNVDRGQISALPKGTSHPSQPGQPVRG